MISLKTIVINAGPKKRGFNAEMAKSALRGAQSVGAEVEFIDLYRLKFTGCLSCLICMRDDFESCKCFLRDDLSPLIDRILDADCLLIAAPIFFSNPSSHYMALLERLIFCIVSNKGENLFKGKVNVGLIYTFHYDKGYFEESVRPHFKHSEDILKMLNGEVEIYSAEYDSKKTYSTSFDGEISSEDEYFTLNLEKAYEIGVKLSN